MTNFIVRVPSSVESGEYFYASLNGKLFKLQCPYTLFGDIMTVSVNSNILKYKVLPNAIPGQPFRGMVNGKMDNLICPTELAIGELCE